MIKNIQTQMITPHPVHAKTNVEASSTRKVSMVELELELHA
jgi:hypothetical protein